MDASIKLGSFSRLDVVVLVLDELADPCYALLLHFLLVVDSLQKVLAKGGLQEEIEALRIDLTFHHLEAHLFNIVAISPKANVLWHVNWTRLEAGVKLFLQLVLFVAHVLCNGRRSGLLTPLVLLLQGSGLTFRP